jgi:hypothetical protein
MQEYIENNTLRLEVSHRGGGIEIDLSDYLKMDGAKMTAYQNYLGGGMLGAVQSDCNIRGWQSTELKGAIEKMQDELKQYFYNLSNEESEDYDEWSGGTYEQVQSRPGSAY